MDILDTMKIITGEENVVLLQVYLDLAKKKILNHTRRTIMLEEFEPVQLDIALLMYNGRGVEGEASHSEGGISASFISIDTMLKTLNDKRLAKVGGVTYEKKPVEDVPGQETDNQ